MTKKMATEILFQDDLDNLAESVAERIERKLELNQEAGMDVYTIIFDELSELFPDLKYKYE